MERTKSVNFQDFSKQYRDPRWQRKRLEVMERDGFCCSSCRNKKKTLNVHHRTPYQKETRIWEYEMDELTTLCEPCHKEISELINLCSSIVMNCCYNLISSYILYEIMMHLDGMAPNPITKYFI